MKGYSFLLLSLVTGGAGIALYKAGPLLDRWLRRLNAHIAAASAQRSEADENVVDASKPHQTSFVEDSIGNERMQALKSEIEAALREGESVSNFIEAAVKGRIARRREDADLLAQALKARSEFADGTPTHSADEVHAALAEKLAAGKRRLGQR